MQKEGLKHRLGNGYGKFGRNGSVWRWNFLWNSGKSRYQDGYDCGKVLQNADIFERLKVRFFQSVLLENRYYQKAYFFSLFLCQDTRKEDIHVFDLHIIQRGLSYEFRVEFTPMAKELFSQGSLKYISELVYWAETQANNSTKHNITHLIAEANQKYSKPKEEPNKAQIFWENLCKACFNDNEAEFLKSIKAKVDEQKGIFYLQIIEREQYYFLENEAFEKWAWYFEKHLIENLGFKLQYVLQEPEPAKKLQDVQQQLIGLWKK